ncbi:hypothetical protein Tco_0092137 [Tanacetum coccineum]
MDKSEHGTERAEKAKVKVKAGAENEEILNGLTHKSLHPTPNPSPSPAHPTSQNPTCHLGNPKLCHWTRNEDKKMEGSDHFDWGTRKMNGSDEGLKTLTKETQEAQHEEPRFRIRSISRSQCSLCSLSLVLF